MAESSLQHDALTTLDWALRQTDPISRMMLIEQALKLHRRAMEAQEDDAADEHATTSDAARLQRH